MKIIDYIKLRSLLEDVGMDLDQAFFDRHMANGIRLVYGILVDKDQEVLEDQQNQSPELMKHWKYK